MTFPTVPRALVRSLACCLAVLAGDAPGAEIEARSTTFVGVSPVVLERQVRTVLPLVELVGLSVRNIETSLADDLRLTIDGWASAEIGGERVLGGDLGVAWIEGRFAKKHLRVRLGRQFVTGGAARALFIDGLLAEGRFPYGFGVTGYVGQPVARAFSNYGVGDLAAGARVFWAPTVATEVGVSLTEQLSRSHLARRDVGVDGRWRPHRKVTLSGSATLSLAEMRLAELDVGPSWQPWEDLEVRAVYRRTAPDLFLSRSSIFSVFAETTRDEAGATAYYQLTRRLGLSVDGRALFLQGENGYEVAANALYRPRRRPDTSLTVTLRRMQVPLNAFVQARVGARHTLTSGVGLALDVDVYGLDKPVNGQTVSLAGNATLTWAFAHSWLVAATLFAGTTPTFETRTEAVAKLIYTFEPARGE